MVVDVLFVNVDAVFARSVEIDSEDDRLQSLSLACL